MKVLKALCVTLLLFAAFLVGYAMLVDVGIIAREVNNTGWQIVLSRLPANWLVYVYFAVLSFIGGILYLITGPKNKL